jgi:two-component system OmpR family response regulator
MDHILIIEDNDQINDLLASLLSKNSLFTVRQAYSGTEGLRFLMEEKFQLLLLDLSLPGKNGITILKEVVTHYQTPVIVITATNDQKTKVELLTAGADDFIAKPFDLDEVYARIIAVLRRSKLKSPEATEHHEFKDISVDRQNLQVQIADKQLALTAIELEILLLFMINPKKVFTKANIYESVWKEKYFDDEAIINTHISNLRNKLNKTGKMAPYIETIWGIGYKLADE